MSGLLRNPMLMIALAITGGIAVWGIIDTAGLTALARRLIVIQFTSRAWFIMLTVSFILVTSVALAFSRYGSIVIGADDDTPEFSTLSWLTMLFAAGMGVGLLYWGTAEPLTHFIALDGAEGVDAVSASLFVTNFHWGFHAWAIYALSGLVIGYFGFRKGWPTLIGSPILAVFGQGPIPRGVAWLSDLLAIVAIAIGLGGSVAMGVFQIADGVEILFGMEAQGITLMLAVFAVLVVAYLPPLTVDLSKGMALLSNIAMAIAVVLMLYVLLAGPTHTIMGGLVQAGGEYLGSFFVQGFRTFTFMDEVTVGWFQDWTLTYMVWWLAWAPFVGVFIARISKGRTIREYLLGVIVAPSAFSVMWFGIFGGAGFAAALNDSLPVLDLVRDDTGAVTFYMLRQYPLSNVTIVLTLLAAFLFLVTSVVSAAFVLGMFSTRGDLNPSTRVKLGWGVILGALGLVMILSGSIGAVKSIIALGALPFVCVVLLLVVCFLKALKDETP